MLTRKEIELREGKRDVCDSDKIMIDGEQRTMMTVTSSSFWRMTIQVSIQDLCKLEYKRMPNGCTVSEKISHIMSFRT